MWGVATQVCAVPEPGNPNPRGPEKAVPCQRVQQPALCCQLAAASFGKSGRQRSNVPILFGLLLLMMLLLLLLVLVVVLLLLLLLLKS